MKKLIVGITASNSVDLLHRQLNFLQKNGFDVALLAPMEERVTKFCIAEGIRHIPINVKRNISLLHDLLTLLNLFKIFIREKPDIINLGTPKISLLGMVAGKLAGVPYRIYTCRGYRFEHEKGALKSLLIFLEKITALCSHRIFCISKSVRDLGIKMKLFPVEKTWLIADGSSNGVDLSLFNVKHLNEEVKMAIIEKYNLKGKVVFGFVGRLVDRKGLCEMHDAFIEFYQQYPRSRLLVVGRPFWDQIHDKTIIDKLKNHPGVIMVGFQPLNKVPYFLSVMDVFLLPAHWEGFGNVLIQAAAMGVPIIATEVTGVKDAVSADYNGVLVPKKDHDALVEAMHRIANDKSLREKLGANGVQWSKNFHPEIIWKGYVDLFEEPI